MKNVLVWPTWAWTCQECLFTVTGFNNKETADADSESHECEVYE